MEEQKNIEYTETPIDPENKEINRHQRIERLLRDARRGWTCSVHRRKPGWCSGFLERIELSPDEMIDLGYLAHEWGGEVLTLRICDEEGNWIGGADVRIGHGVKFRGRHITPETWDQKNEMIKQPEQAPAQAPAALGDILAGVMEVMQRSRQDDLAMIRDLIAATAANTAAIAPAAIAPAAPVDLIKQLEGLAGTYERLHTIFGAVDGGGAASGGADDLFATINNVTSVISKLSAKKEQPAATAPKPQPRLHGASATPPAGVKIPSQPLQPNADMVVKYLSGLSPAQAADIVADSLADMPDEKREATIREFLTSYGTETEDEFGEEEIEAEDEAEDERTEASRTV
jgi:hypothetical protein